MRIEVYKNTDGSFEVHHIDDYPKVSDPKKEVEYIRAITQNSANIIAGKVAANATEIANKTRVFG